VCRSFFCALQEAQQDTIMSFERYMSDCMTRDWAADKQGLFSSVAPFTGLAAGGSGMGGLSFGSVARADGEEWGDLALLSLFVECCLSACCAGCLCIVLRRRGSIAVGLPAR
jgi:hypothetical protein